MVEPVPERDRPAVKRRLRRAWACDDHRQALTELQARARRARPLAPRRRRVLREGLDETLTITRLGVRGALKRTLESTTRANR